MKPGAIANSVLRALHSNCRHDEEKDFFEGVAEWLDEWSDYYVCKTTSDLRDAALQETNLVEPENET